ncbi:MAG: hypothetical protein COA99_15920 [Moraxellaceae bacterium]|nr:MAG: hypothetical protein COA99_15920 [Moraxellaceae bacterium]
MSGFSVEPIFSNTQSKVSGIWEFTLFWNAVCWPVLFATQNQLVAQYQRNDWVLLPILLFPVIGIITLVLAIKAGLAWRRFGATPLFLNPFPGAIGGHVAGKICLPNSVPKDIRYDVSLVCVYTYETRNAQNENSSAERMIWQHSLTGQLRRGMDGMDLLFCFDVPEGLPRSEDLSGNYHHWRLHIHAEMDAEDLDRSFHIPVHPTNQQTTLKVTEDIRGNARHHLELIAELMRVEVSPGLLHLYFPKGRGKLMGAIVGGTGSVLMALGFALLRQGGLERGSFVFTLTGLALVFIGLSALLCGIYTVFNSLNVKLTKNAIGVRRSIFGVSMYNRQLKMTQVKRLVVEEGMFRQVIGKQTVMYKIVAIGRGGEKMVLAEGLIGRELAEETLRFIRANGNLAV